VNTATNLTRFNFSTLNMAPIQSVERPDVVHVSDISFLHFCVYLPDTDDKIVELPTVV
jgi:hypothetical protein